MKNKKIVPITAIAVLSVTALGISAEISVKQIKAYLNEGIHVIYKGENQLMYDANGNQVYPITYNDSTYIPLRAISKIFGEEIAWNEAENSVLLGEDAKQYYIKLEELRPKASTKSAPLEFNKWGITSKYDENTKDYKEISTQITNITRGEDAKNIVEEWCKNSSTDTLQYNSELEEGMEWLIVDYETDLTNMSKSTTGNTTIIKAVITSSDERYTELLYNNTLYDLSVYNIGSNELIKTKTGTNRFAVQIPIGCTDYLIQMGEPNYANAYFKGK